MSSYRNPQLAEKLLIAVRRALQGEGINPGCRLHIVIDGDHIERGTASFGDMEPARIRKLVDSSLAQYEAQTLDAVQAINKHMLHGILPHLQLKTNG